MGGAIGLHDPVRRGRPAGEQPRLVGAPLSKAMRVPSGARIEDHPLWAAESGGSADILSAHRDQHPSSVRDRPLDRRPGSEGAPEQVQVGSESRMRCQVT